MKRFVRYTLVRKSLTAILTPLVGTLFFLFAIILDTLFARQGSLRLVIVGWIAQPTEILYFLLLVFLVMLVTVLVIGIPVSLFSDWATYKLPNRWRMIVAALIHVGGAISYELYKLPLEELWSINSIETVLALGVSLSYWIIDELIRRRQEKKQPPSSETEPVNVS